MGARDLASVLLLVCVSALGQQTDPAPAPTPSPAPQPHLEAPVADHPNGSSSSPKSATTSLPDLTPDAHGALSQEQMQQLFRVVADKDLENEKKLRDYTYIERDVENHLDGKGRTKSTEVKTYEVMEIYGEQVNRLIEKDEKPLAEKDAKKEEEKIQKAIEKRK